MHDVEIEIQARIGKIAPLLKFLKEYAKLKYTSKEKDEYFTPPHRNFLAVRPVTEWFRLRDRDGKYSFTYKNWHYDKKGKSHYCDEYESILENPSMLRRTLIAMNFKPITKVNKTRSAWKYNNYEISVDKVRGLGDFVEIEFKGNTKHAKPEVITSQMVKFLKQINVGKVELNYQGYPFLLLFPGDSHFEVV